MNHKGTEIRHEPHYTPVAAQAQGFKVQTNKASKLNRLRSGGLRT